MADNDRFVIQKITTNKKCFFREQDGINQHTRTRCLIDPQSYEYVFDSDCKKCQEGKTISEYEDMILQTINKELDKVLKNGEKINNIGLAKAVVDRLFGEGE